MLNFNTHNDVMSCFLSVSPKENAKLDNFLKFLDESGVARFIEEELGSFLETRGRKPFNPYKLFSLIDGTAKLDYWIAPESLKPEIRPAEINFKKLLSERKPGENEKLRRNNRKYKRRNRP